MLVFFAGICGDHLGATLVGKELVQRLISAFVEHAVDGECAGRNKEQTECQSAADAQTYRCGNDADRGMGKIANPPITPPTVSFRKVLMARRGLAISIAMIPTAIMPTTK